MKRAFLCGVAVVLCGAAMAFAGQATPGSGKFAAADADNDGFLSKDEFAAAFPGLKAEAFTMIDKNGDGRISPEEWGAFSMGHGGGKPPRGAAGAMGGTDLPVEPVPQQGK